MIELSENAVRGRTEGLVSSEASPEQVADIDARMLWSALIEPGDGVAGALISAFGPRKALEAILSERSPTTVGAREIAEGRRRWLPRAPDAVRAGASAQRAAVQVVTPETVGWPQRLNALGVHAPPCLWVRGDRRAFGDGHPAIALVGARAASAYGEHVVGELAAELAAAGVGIVSGGAYGIDGMAHRAALAAGGRTVAWLAGGVDRPYPSGHRGLLEEIVRSGGAVVADVPCGSSPTKWRFLARNRLIAAAADATVVVEAGWRSGSLNTAGHAAQLGRPLGAVPGPVTSASSSGCHRLLREYDAQCITSAQDVRELIGLVSQAPTLYEDAPRVQLERVCDALSARVARTVEEIARRSGVSPEDARSSLGLLALEGRAHHGPDGWRADRR